MKDWMRLNLARIVFTTIIFALGITVLMPESSSAQCGGGLFGRRRERVAARREARMERLERSESAFGCSGESRVVYVHAAPQQQAPAGCNCQPQASAETNYPAAIAREETYYVSAAVPPLIYNRVQSQISAWDSVPPGVLRIEANPGW